MAGIEASILDKTMEWFEKELEPANTSLDTVSATPDCMETYPLERLII